MMKTITAFIFFFIWAMPGIAQNAKIDSLNRLISKAGSDTARINLVNKKIVSLIETNLDEAIKVANKNIEDANKINYPKGEAETRLQLSTCYCFKGEYATARMNLELAEKICNTTGTTSELCQIYAGYGMMYGMQSIYDTSIIYYNKAIAAEKEGDPKRLATYYSNLAIGYQMQSNYSQALAWQQKSLQLAEKTGNLNSQAYTLLNMGDTYLYSGDSVLGEKVMVKSLDIAQKLGLTNVELYAYSNLSSLYHAQHKFEMAWSLAMKSAELAKKMGDPGIMCAGLAKAASARASQGKFSEAEVLAKQAVALSDSSNQPLNIFQAYSAMGEVLKLQAKYKEAIPYYEKSFRALDQSDLYGNATRVAYTDLSECYEKTGNNSKALAAYKVAAQIADSVRSRQSVRKATELMMNYEFDKKQQASQAKQKEETAAANTKQLLLLIGLVSMLILAGFAFYAYRNKQKANSLLKGQKEEIQTTLTKLKTTQTQLIQSEKMASLGELTAGIAHEIQNPLNFVNNFSEVNTELIDEMKEEIDKGNIKGVKALANNIAENEQKINHHGKRADAIVKGMLQHSRSNSGIKEPTDINALCDEYLRLSYHGLRAKDKSFNATMKTDFDNSIGNINIIPQDIGRVILNLLTNAFYAASLPSKGGFSDSDSNKTPTVWVSTKKEGNKVLISLRDNGPGIPQKILDKIFQPFFTTKPTGQGTGLGLSLSYDIVTKGHGGELKVETKEGEGSVFIIKLPL